MPTKLLKPATNKTTGKPNKVRMPDKPGTHLPEKGAKVELNKWWRRRLRDGSVIDPAAGKDEDAKAKTAKK
ncbi:MAG: hypothetical protein C0613_08325 [Desulfobulbaceae bacterium]|nr:MAG: hypothetical protein C0613_08325 [Desulfobulbaceae bacterium]